MVATLNDHDRRHAFTRLSRSAAVVTKKEKGGTFAVDYAGFVDEDGVPVSEGGLDRKRLRLVPDGADKGWTPIVNEIVEVNEDDCWWEARVEVCVAYGAVQLSWRAGDDSPAHAGGAGNLLSVRLPCAWRATPAARASAIIWSLTMARYVRGRRFRAKARRLSSSA